DGDREGDGKRELFVENAGGSRKEADRDKHRDEHQRGGDDGAGDLGHSDAGGLVRVVGGGFIAFGCQRFFYGDDVGGVGVRIDFLVPLGDDGAAGEVALHVLDDDDGVVNDQSGGE